MGHRLKVLGTTAVKIAAGFLAVGKKDHLDLLDNCLPWVLAVGALMAVVGCCYVRSFVGY